MTGRIDVLIKSPVPLKTFFIPVPSLPFVLRRVGPRLCLVATTVGGILRWTDVGWTVVEVDLFTPGRVSLLYPKVGVQKINLDPRLDQVV